MKKLSNRQQLLLSAIALIMLMLFSLSIGRYSNNPLDAIRAILGRFDVIKQPDIAMENIIFHVRLPRIFGAVYVGAMLSLSGAVYQVYLKTPCIPRYIRVSSGASVGTAISILLGYGLIGRQIFAFIFGLLAVLLTTTIPKVFRNSSNMMMVLSGIIVGGF